IASLRIGKVALGEHGQKRHCNWIERGNAIGRVGKYVADKRLSSSVGIIGKQRIIDRVAVVGKIAAPFRGGGNGKDVGTIKQFLVRVFIIRKEEKLLVNYGAADGAAFLVAMKA